MLEVSNENFDRIINSDRSVSILFYATYCPYCKRFIPIFEKYEKDMRSLLARSDITDDDNPLWEKYSINAVPTVIVFKKGAEVGRIMSRPSLCITKDDFEDLLNRI